MPTCLFQMLIKRTCVVIVYVLKEGPFLKLIANDVRKSEQKFGVH